MSKSIPIPKVDLSPMEQSARFATDPVSLQLEAQKQLGDIFELDLIGMPPFIIVGSAELTSNIFDNRDAFHGNGNFAAFLQEVLGDSSVMFQEGEEHKEHTRALRTAMNAPDFDFKAVFRSQIGWLEREIDEWPDKKAFALLPELRRLNAMMMIEVILGTTSTGASKLAASVCKVADWASTTLNWVADDWSPLKELDQLLYKEISEIRRTRRNCLLHQLDKAYKYHREDYELRDMTMTLLIPGFASSSVVAGWMLHAMQKYPEYSTGKLKEELAAYEETIDRGHDSYLSAFANETMRVYPPLVSVQKRVVDSYELEHKNIRATLSQGTIIAPSLPLLHWDGSFWEDPRKFDPGRFLAKAYPPKEAHFIPFGHGTHNCIGQSMAYPLTFLLVAIVTRKARRFRHPQGYRPKIVRLGGNLAASEEMPVLIG